MTVVSQRVMLCVPPGFHRLHRAAQASIGLMQGVVWASSDGRIDRGGVFGARDGFLCLLRKPLMHLMSGFETRIGRLEAASCQSRRPGISGERRKALTDRADQRDLEALQELSVYRPSKTGLSRWPERFEVALC